MDQELTVAQSAATRRRRSKLGTIPERAFTLLEMLAVVALIATLTALTLPALQGLMGVGGLRGGVNSVLVAFDQARAAAIESGTDAYVGFPEKLDDENADKSSLLIFRKAKQGEGAAGPVVPLSRWIKLPQGILMDLSEVEFDPAELPTDAADSLPQLDGKDVAVRVIRYDRFGRIVTGPDGAGRLKVRVGDGISQGGDVVFKGGGGKMHEILTAQRLTGRWLVSTP